MATSMSSGPSPETSQQLLGDVHGLVVLPEVVAVVVVHFVTGRGVRLGGDLDLHRLLAQVLGPVGAGEDGGDTPAALLAAVEEAEDGLDDPPRVLVVVEGDGPVVEPGVGVGG